MNGSEGTVGVLDQDGEGSLKARLFHDVNDASRLKAGQVAVRLK